MISRADPTYEYSLWELTPADLLALEKVRPSLLFSRKLGEQVCLKELEQRLRWKTFGVERWLSSLPKNRQMFQDNGMALAQDPPSVQLQDWNAAAF